MASLIRSSSSPQGRRPQTFNPDKSTTSLPNNDGDWSARSTLVITDKHDGTTQIEAGHGSWANKVTGAAVCVAVFIWNPIAGSVLFAGETKNIVDHAELPRNVIAVVKAYVAQAKAPSNRRLSTAGTLVNM